MIQAKPKVLFFDVNETLLDLAIMKKQVKGALGGKEDLLSLWFTTMLQYSLVMSASKQYKPFGYIGAAALQMVAANNGITLTQEKAREIVVKSMQNLPVHPEVKEALSVLKNEDYKLVALTNSSKESLKNKFENVGLTNYFDALLSIEAVKKFKPFTDTYHWAASTMQVKPEECMLIAAHGWDVAGALWAGYRAAFVSRPGQQVFPLAPQCEINETNLKKVADILITYN
ncbi:haloacid dehalogenase type II [Lacinutrix sp. C3R15]|uniref:haloacid dehalogenase type II n=1 Tax=Flavobacteriaceae TaxID=49546 RepID=UPI001C09EB93|nr:MULTISPECIES: haloacid dehalogenase type II [Flavobacteriaceae]MBU2938259.1 haloacid dehalogenase type II [Lacinutrix sp. C3R15]MDO6621573.1 haloacid dehalogenase type II [Oceanihabitans sp. 1_MG-2023]